MGVKGMLPPYCLPLRGRVGVTLTDSLKYKKIVTGFLPSQNIIKKR
jgi:hypothetical protein